MQYVHWSPLSMILLQYIYVNSALWSLNYTAMQIRQHTVKFSLDFNKITWMLSIFSLNLLRWLFWCSLISIMSGCHRTPHSDSSVVTFSRIVEKTEYPCRKGKYFSYFIKNLFKNKLNYISNAIHSLYLNHYINWKELII